MPFQTWRDRAHTLLQDVRFAVRTLRNNPGFTAVAVLTLAIGIGMNSAIFSVVNGVLLKPLPFRNPDQLIRIWQIQTENGTNQQSVASAVDVDDWRARRRLIADLGGYFYMEGMSGTDMTGIGEPQHVDAAFVTPGFFSTLGVPAQIGRVPRDDEMVRGSNDHVVVLSSAFWRRQFGSQTSVVGRRVTLGGESYEIVGVMPRDFRFPLPRIEMFIPYSTIPDDAIPRIRPARILSVVGRLRPGVTVAQAYAEMNSITRGLAEQYPENRNAAAADVAPLRDSLVGKVRTTLLVLFGAVGCVLLITAVNLAGLMLARGTTRGRELAIRSALGAERGRIIGQLVTESLVLALLGGIAGVAIAQLGGWMLVQLASGQLPRAEDVGLDTRVVLFTFGVALLTGVAFGLVPAIRASSPRLQDSLRAGTRGSTRGTGGLRNVLVIAEVALAMILVCGAGLMTRSFVKLLEVDLGFRPEHRVAISFTISMARHSKEADIRETYRQMLERVRTVPGVIAAGAIRDLPFHGDGEPMQFMPPGTRGIPRDKRPTAILMFTSDGFFNAMGIPLIAGRDLSRQDRQNTPLVFVVNQAFGRKFTAGRNPVGQLITVGDTSRYPIVGLVGDVRQDTVDEDPTPRVYASVYQIFRVKTSLVVRTQADPKQMITRVEDAIRTVDPQQTFTDAGTMEAAIGTAVARPRLLTVLLGIFGAIGLVLGALGLYGVLSYLVNQRTREIGVRVALGAQSRDILGMVVRRGLGLAAAGIACGIAGALLVTRLMQGVLYGVSSADPPTYSLVAVVLLTVAALASWLPALRASRVDPLVALRAE
ncbi:MAG TPA: ABC transporter permease [Gemmatimonadaceae bacterium]|jgi:predicted permease|nr:ABC transporter permease [Gemmatimonadaceae bacterium]